MPAPDFSFLTAFPLFGVLAVLAVLALWGVRRWLRRLRPLYLIGVLDGDTVRARLAPEGPPERVRLLGMDAPERGQRHYEASRQALARLLGRKGPWYLRAYGRDQYGRTLARLYCARRRDVGLAMIWHGWAWPCGSAGGVLRTGGYRLAGAVAGVFARGARGLFAVSPMAHKRSLLGRLRQWWDWRGR